MPTRQWPLMNTHYEASTCRLKQLADASLSLSFLQPLNAKDPNLERDYGTKMFLPGVWRPRLVASHLRRWQTASRAGRAAAVMRQESDPMITRSSRRCIHPP